MKPGVHQYEDKLLEFAYGELPPPEAEAVEAHLRHCPRCSEALAQITQVRSAMSQLPRQAAPDAGLDSLLAYAEQTARRNAQAAGRAAPWWRRFMAPLATAMAMAVVGVVAWRVNERAAFDPTQVALEQHREKAEAMRRAEPPAAAPAEEQAQANAEGGGAKAEETAALAKGLGTVNNWSNSGATGRAGAASKEALEQKAQSAKPQAHQAASNDVLGGGGALGGLGSRGGSAYAPSRTSQAKRSAPAKKKLAAREDLDTAGGYDEPAQAPAPQPVALAEKSAKVQAQLGLRDDTETAAAEAPAPKDKNKEAERAEAPPPPMTQSVARPAAPSAAPSAPQGSSFGLSLSGKSDGVGGPSSASGDSFDRVAEAPADRKAADDAAPRQRQQASRVDALVEEGRRAGARGDAGGAVKAYLAALRLEPRGEAKVEVLKGLCDGFTALGDGTRADPYCDELVRDHPNTAAARAVMARRSYQQAGPRAVRKPAAADEAEPARPTNAPASTSY